MRIATKAALLFSAVAMLALPLGIAHAALSPEPAQRSSDETGGLNLVAGKGGGASATNVLTTIYDNVNATALFTVSSTDLLSTWGDQLLTTGVGLLSTHIFTLYNSSTSAGPLLTATISINFFDGVTSAPLGGYSGSVNFGAGLPVNNYSVITASGLDPALINLTTTNIIVTQKVTAKTGTASRLGIVTFGPVLTGASPGTMYISSATIGGGVPGFYNLGQPADPGYLVAVNPPPVGTLSKSWGALKKLYH